MKCIQPSSGSIGGRTSDAGFLQKATEHDVSTVPRKPFTVADLKHSVEQDSGTSLTYDQGLDSRRGGMCCPGSAIDGD